MTTTALLGVAIAGVAVGALGLLVGLLAHLRVTRAGKECQERAGRAGFVDGISVDPRAIRNVAMLRYDAFQDMGGRLSFSLALLDSAGDGVILSSINAHSETRTYAKVIEGGQSTHDLSPEERQALGRAYTKRRARGNGNHRAETPSGAAVETTQADEAESDAAPDRAADRR